MSLNLNQIASWLLITRDEYLGLLKTESSRMTINENVYITQCECSGANWNCICLPAIASSYHLFITQIGKVIRRKVDVSLKKGKITFLFLRCFFVDNDLTGEVNLS